MDNIIMRGVLELYRDNKYLYAHLLQKMNVVLDNTMPTMGVGYDKRKEQITLYYNKQFADSLSNKEMGGVLEHEVLHLISNHINREQGREHERWNVACDLAINQIVGKDRLPKQGCFIENMKLPKNLLSEEYYELLLQKGQNNPSHDRWKEIKEGMGKVSQKELEQAIKEGLAKEGKDLESIMGKEHGDMAKEVMVGLADTFRISEMNWKQILSKLIQFASETYKISTRKRPNRRFGNLYPANQTKLKLKVYCGVDTSGSISDEDLHKFHSELAFINGCGYEGFTMLECSTEIHKVYDLKHIPKERSGSGGTDFNPVFDKAREDKADLVIYFTDGQGNYPDKPKVPTLWVLTEDYEVPFGRKVILK